MNRLKTFSIFFLSMLMLISTSVVFAQRNERPYLRCRDNFKAMDTNKDGKVSLDEFKAVKHPRGNADDIFKSRDTNKDGFLTLEEFCAGKGRGAGYGKGRNR